MENIKNYIIEMFSYSKIEWAIGGMVGLVGGFFKFMVGDFDYFVQILLAIMFLDILTGIMLSWKKRETSSEKGINGISKKIGIWVMIAFANIVDMMLGETGALRTGAIMFYFAMEGLSLLENLTAMGVPQFQPLAKYLIQIKEGNKKAPSKLKEEDE